MPLLLLLCLKPDPAASYSVQYELLAIKDGGANGVCTGTLEPMQSGRYLFVISASDASASPAQPTQPDQRTFTLTGLEITLGAPRFGIAKTTPMAVLLRTHEVQDGVDAPRDAVCKWADGSVKVDANSLSQAYSAFPNTAQSADQHNHTLSFPGKGTLQVLCRESSGRISYASFAMDVDFTPPNFGNFSVRPQPVIDPGRRYAVVSFQTDDNATCILQQTMPSSGAVQQFPTEDESDRSTYKRIHEATISYATINDELEHNFNYTIYCKNLASWTSKRNTSVQVKLGAGIFVLSPGQITNSRRFTLAVQATFLPTSCTANGHEMARSADDLQVFTLGFDTADGEHSFAIRCAADQKEASINYTVTSDSTPPPPPVISTNNTVCGGKLHAHLALNDAGTPITAFNITISDNKGWTYKAAGLDHDWAITPPASLGDQVTWTAFATDLAGNAGALNTTQLANVHVGEDEECGGPAFIRIVKPGPLGFAAKCESTMGGQCRFTLAVATTRQASCVYAAETGTSLWSAAIPFTSDDDLLHTKPGVAFTQRRIMVNCTETASRKNHSAIFLVGSDLTKPTINLQVLPSATVVDRANALLAISAITDDPTYCTFDAKPFGNLPETDQHAYVTSHDWPLDLRASDEGEKTYAVICKNLASLSTTASVNILVNYHAKLQVAILSPPSYTAEKEITLIVKPNKQGTCTYKANRTATPAEMSAGENGTHTAGLGILGDGSHTYFVTCTSAAEGEQGSAIASFTIDSTVPVIKRIEGQALLCPGDEGEYTPEVESIDGAPTLEYAFQNVTQNTTASIIRIDTSDLEQGEHSLSVTAINRAGARSEPSTIAFTLLSSDAAECKVSARHCLNTKRDIGEAGIDCGGTCPKACVACTTDADCMPNSCVQDVCAITPPCRNATTDCDDGLLCISSVCREPECTLDMECTSGACVGGMCTSGSSEPVGTTDHCADGLRDGDEEDVDCGGSCAVCVQCDPQTTPCEQVGMTCSESGFCIPSEQPSCFNGRQDGIEDGVDCGGDCEAPCSTSDGTPPAADSCSNGRQDDDEEGIDCGGSCVNPCDAQQQSHLLSILLIAVGLAVMGGAGYYLYQQNEGKKAQSARLRTASPLPGMPSHMSPIAPMNPALEQKYTAERQARDAALKEAYAKQEAAKAAQRKALFQSFDASQSPSAKQPSAQQGAQAAKQELAKSAKESASLADATSDTKDGAKGKAKAGDGTDAQKTDLKEKNAKPGKAAEKKTDDAFEALEKIGK